LGLNARFLRIVFRLCAAKLAKVGAAFTGFKLKTKGSIKKQAFVAGALSRLFFGVAL